MKLKIHDGSKCCLITHCPSFLYESLDSSLCFLCPPFCFRPCCHLQSLLGPEEPLSRGSRCSLQLLGVVISENPSVLPKELWQRGLTPPERPLIFLLSGEPQVTNTHNLSFTDHLGYFKICFCNCNYSHFSKKHCIHVQASRVHEPLTLSAFLLYVSLKEKNCPF